MNLKLMNNSEQAKYKDTKIKELVKEINRMKNENNTIDKNRKFSKDVQGGPCNVVPGHLTTCQQGRLPAVERQGDLTSLGTYQRSSEYNTSTEPAALDTSTENFGDSYQMMSESDSNSAYRPKRRDSDKRSKKTDRDSSSDSSYKSSKEVFKVLDQSMHKKKEAERRNNRKIKKLEESKIKDREKMQEMKKQIDELKAIIQNNNLPTNTGENPQSGVNSHIRGTSHTGVY